MYKNTHKAFTGGGKSRKSFTLAEVLVVIFVLGVLAIETIPSLLTNFQEMQYKVAFKKIYSDLASATTMAMLDNGGTMQGIAPDSAHQTLGRKYEPYLRLLKDCDDWYLADDEWYVVDSWYSLDGDPGSPATTGIMLSNGAFLNFFSYHFAACDFGSLGDACGWITIDVNGAKAPNTYGKDIFGVYILKDRIRPRGTPGDFYENDCVSTDNGVGCAAKVLQNIDY